MLRPKGKSLSILKTNTVTEFYSHLITLAHHSVLTHRKKGSTKNQRSPDAFSEDVLKVLSSVAIFNNLIFLTYTFVNQSLLGDETALLFKGSQR